MNFFSPQSEFRHPGGRPHKYPWKTMQVGDSFFVPNKRANSMSELARKVGVKVRCRTVMKNGDKGCKVERIA